MERVDLTPEIVGTKILTEFDGHEIAYGINIIGDIQYYGPDKGWRCLANVNGALCVIQVRVYKKEGS